MKLTFKRLLTVSLVAIVVGITVLSLLPPRSGVELGSHDKVNHLIAYLTFSLNLGLLLNSWKNHLKFLFIPVFYGLFMEYCQGFVPGREVSLLDALANASGAIIGFMVLFALRRK